MNLLKILSASFAGTSLMTAFSYYRSDERNRQFKEPVLLNKLLTRTRFRKPALELLPLPGWLIHYMIGTSYTICYHYLWKCTNVNPTVQSGLWLGLISGLNGSAGWKLIFSNHPDPPDINFKKFYQHLLPAHIIFALGATAVYKISQNKIKRNQSGSR
ncbi:MAG: hypothetical protein WEA56_04665 [Balneolaceae bacterium]